MTDVNYTQYWDEIRSIASELVAESMEDCDNDRDAAEDQINDYRLHEWIDGHQWVIYYGYNDDVLRHTDNDDAYKGIYSNEDIGRIIADNGLDSFKTQMAYFAMYADVMDHLSDAFDEYESNLEEPA